MLGNGFSSASLESYCFPSRRHANVYILNKRPTPADLVAQPAIREKACLKGEEF